jgi:uncharacterized protein YlaN (UPF0358 family)
VESPREDDVVTDFTVETQVERRMAAILRQDVEGAIAKKGREWAQDVLGVSGPAIEALLWDQRWTVDRAVHIAAALGLLSESDVDQLVANGSKQ